MRKDINKMKSSITLRQAQGDNERKRSGVVDRKYKSATQGKFNRSIKAGFIIKTIKQKQSSINEYS